MEINTVLEQTTCDELMLEAQEHILELTLCCCETQLTLSGRQQLYTLLRNAGMLIKDADGVLKHITHIRNTYDTTPVLTLDITAELNDRKKAIWDTINRFTRENGYTRLT